MKHAAGLLAVDVDGTLITDHGCITDKVYDALEKVVSLNWEVVIASGRTFHAAKSKSSIVCLLIGFHPAEFAFVPTLMLLFTAYKTFHAFHRIISLTPSYT